ncbi:MAG: two-component system, OmpR family, sensor kinase, partial [Solirubrobacteraceae bacterium]|nr:two-component system, OmpR family, sensor kinase [Solirubrobacteraceae bacterium]
MTLRLRILAGVALIIVGCLTLAFAAIYRGADANLRQAIDQDLRGDMSAFTRAVTGSADPYAAARRYVDSQPFRASTRLLFAEFPARAPISNEPELVGRDERSEKRPVTDGEARIARDVLGARGLSTRSYPDVGDLRLLVRTAGGVRFGVGEPLNSLDRAKHGIRRAFVVAGALALGAALLAGAALSLGVTRRLRRMAALAERVHEGDLAPRMGSGGAHDEVHHLAVAFDTMLDRLQDAFDRQTAFVADASHELRTPLTIVRGQLEVLAREPSPTAQDVRRVERLVLTEVQRMSRMVDDLLVLAAPTVHKRPTALAPLLRDLLATLDGTADRRFEPGPVAAVVVQADPDRLAQALRNLLRNAVEHTAPGGTV